MNLLTGTRQIIEACGRLICLGLLTRYTDLLACSRRITEGLPISSTSLFLHLV